VKPTDDERDPERLDWLAANPDRLQDVYSRLLDEDDTLREAIDYFMQKYTRADDE